MNAGHLASAHAVNTEVSTVQCNSVLEKLDDNHVLLITLKQMMKREKFPIAHSPHPLLIGCFYRGIKESKTPQQEKPKYTAIQLLITGQKNLIDLRMRA